VADNGSVDGSPEIGNELGAQVVTVKKRGYGAALLGGIAAARGKYVIMGDADNSYDFSNLMLFVEKLREGYELVMGNRFRGGIQPGAMPFLHYYLGNPVLTGIGRLFFKSPCRDFHCGLRGFDRKAIETLKLKTTGMEFASEMVVKATIHGLRITEIPTTLDPDGRSREPHLRSWRDGWRHLRFLLMYSPRWLFLHPGMLLMIVGFLSGVWLIFEPRSIGTATLDIHTLLYSAVSIIIGYQAVLFGIFTKVFATTVGLAPRDLRLERLCQIITLEVGLLAGMFLFLGGLAGTLYAFSSWASSAFGPQNPSHLMRVAIPSVLSLALGTQTILSSFFLSILGLKRQQLS
jgi:glycosyltransferase involved in cell wall biosynthesis